MQSHDPTSLEYAAKIGDSDTLWNICCYEYLAYVAKNITPEIAANYSFLATLKNLMSWPPEYDQKTSYGQAYSKLMIELEGVFRTEQYEGRKYVPGELDVVLNTIYQNKNRSLERVGRILAEISAAHSQTSKDFLEQIQKRLPQTQGTLTAPINKQNPVTEGSMFNLGRRLVSKTFKPMQITSMPAIRAYEYTKSGKYPIEIRMGTQTQRHEGSAEINPIFREWLKSLARNANQQPNASEIAHLYINNLPRDRDDFAGTKERILTEQLEKLEASQQNIAVVTMPADKGLLRHANLHSNRKDIDGHSAYMQIYNIATDNSEEKIKDFYISERVKKLIYGTEYGSYNKRVEGEIINQLLKNSFSKLGLDINAMLSKSEIAAVYFHFIKYELTNFIFDKLQPQTFNTSCKDGIDRGGASSAYFNLMKSIADGKPMSESEFHTALHAAPVLVKGRPMNEHVEHVWAAIHYALPGLKEKNPQLPRWLSEWDLRNTPQYASAHKHNMDWHVERLLRYIEDRSENADNNRLLKIETAKKLVTLLNKYEIQLEYEDTRALSDGELQKIFHGLVQDGFLSRKYLHKQNLMEYIIDRRGDPDRLRQQKVKTAEKLLRILDGSHEALDENDKIATSDGEMRDLFYALIDDGYFIDAKVEPSAPNYKPYL